MAESDLRSIIVEWMRDDEWNLFTLSEWMRDHHEYTHAEIEQCVGAMLEDGTLEMNWDGTIYLAEDHNS